MGMTKQHVTARIEAQNMQHIFSVCLSRWPHLSVSAAVNLIVAEHLAESERRQRLLCPQFEPLKVIDSARGENGEGKKNFCTPEKSA